MYNLDTLIALAEQNVGKTYDKLEVNFASRIVSMGRVKLDYSHITFEEGVARCLFLYLSNKVQ